MCDRICRPDVAGGEARLPHKVQLFYVGAEQQLKVGRRAQGLRHKIFVATQRFTTGQKMQMRISKS